MSDFETSIRELSERFKPAIVFGARVGNEDELPASMRPESPYEAWGDEYRAELMTAVQLSSSQRMKDRDQGEIVMVLTGLRLAYMKVVSDLADQLEMPEGELHNLISEASNEAQIDDRSEDDPADDGELPPRA